VKAHRAKLYLSEKDLTAANTSSEVSAPRIISINFMIGGGLKEVHAYHLQHGNHSLHNLEAHVQTGAGLVIT